MVVFWLFRFRRVEPFGYPRTNRVETGYNQRKSIRNGLVEVKKPQILRLLKRTDAALDMILEFVVFTDANFVGGQRLNQLR